MLQEKITSHSFNQCQPLITTDNIMEHNIKKLLLIIITISMPAVFSLNTCAAEPEISSTPQIRIIEDNLSTHKFGGDVLQSLATVAGKAENTTNNVINQASITISFYDKNKTLLYTASTTKQNWSPGEIWYFTVKFNSPDAWKTTSYSISTSTE